MSSPSENASIADRIVGAGLIVAAAHLFLKLAGLIQTVVATRLLDTDQYEAIFVVAFQGVILSLFLIGEEVIGPSFLPIFMREMDERDEKSAWSFANAFLTLQAAVLFVAIALVVCFPDTVIGIFTEWTREDRPTGYELLRTSLVWLAPSLFFLSIGSTTYMILNGYKRFFLAAFGDTSWKICVVIALLAGMKLLGFGHEALLFGLLVGSAAKLLTHLAGMLPKLRYCRPSLRWNSPAMRAVLLLMLPLIAGIVFAKFRDVFNNVRILTHIEEKGILQANDLGRKLYAAISWMVPYALQIALFPFLCELVDRRDTRKLGEVLTHSCRLLLSVFVPGSLILALLAPEIAAILFMGGETGAQVAHWSAISTACYLLVLPAAAVECVLMQGYFAHRKMTAVTAIGISCSLISVVISYIFIATLGVRAVTALQVVALGFVLSRCVKSVVLVLVLRRQVPMFPARETLVFLLRLTALGAATALAVWAARVGFAAGIDDGLQAAIQAARDGVEEPLSVNRILLAAKAIVAGCAGAIMIVLGALLFRVQEPFDMVRWCLEKGAERVPALGRIARLVPRP